MADFNDRYPPIGPWPMAGIGEVDLDKLGLSQAIADRNQLNNALYQKAKMLRPLSPLEKIIQTLMGGQPG